jgi:hypothetical protein
LRCRCGLFTAALKAGQGGKHSFDVGMIGPMVDSVMDLYDALDDLLGSSPEEFDKFLRATVK